MVFGIDDAILSALIGGIPNLLTGGMQIAQSSSREKEEKKLKAYDIELSYAEELRRGRENISSLYGDIIRSGQASGLKSVYTPITRERKKKELESNMFRDVKPMLSALGYNATQTATGISAYKGAQSSRGSGGGWWSGAVGGVKDMIGMWFGR